MKTHEEFIKEIQERHPNIKIVGTYTGSANKIEWLCSNCGERQFSLPSNLLKPDATGLCRKCFLLQQAENRKKGNEQFQKELKYIHPDLIVTGTFKGNNHKIEWVCSNCGQKQYSFPGNLLKPTKTPYCRACTNKLRLSIVKKQVGDGTVLSMNQINSNNFYEELGKKEYPPILLSEYKGVREKLRCKCSVCGYEWESRPRDLIDNKHPCPKCADRCHAISNETFIQRLSEINPYVIPLESYVRQDRHIKCRCSRCGHEWSVTPGSLLRGNGCPSCSHTATSFFEQFLLLSFREVLGEDKVVSRDRKTIGSELDVYVPDMKLAIEYGAWFYHKKRITNDLKKAKLCEEKGIRLIRIYDACGEDIVTGKDVLAYSHNIALDINDSIRVVNQIFLMINTGQTIDDERFYAISDKAYILSRRMTTDQFKEKMTAIQPNIEILGVYKSNSSRIPCKCKLCGHKWSPTAHGLLAGYGCPECYHKAQTKTEETYLRELSEINPDIELLESYVASNRRILVRCKKCGHQWKPYASTLLHGYGCVVCRKKAMEHKALTNIMEINPDIEVIGIYQGMGKSIKVRCKKCGNIWSPIVNNLIRNASHCPECSRKSVNRKLRMSTDDFVRRLSEVSPTIEVIGPFNGANNRVNVHCKTCGYEWSPIAMNLLTGRGCRKCKYREQAKRQRRTPEQFAQEMSIINPNIIVFGKYTKACERVEVQCKRCGKKWSPVASSLLAGTGCPSCSKKKNL